MKVYFVGSHSTGKTTLCRYVSSKYSLDMLPEVARMVLAERELSINSLRVDLDLVDDYQNSIFCEQIENEKKYKSFVSDRSLDCIAYAAQHSRILNKIIHSKELIDYVETLKDKDSYIFFVRPSKVTMKEDGVRESLSWDGIIQIDAMVKFLLEMYNLKYYQLSMDNMQERVKLIDSVLDCPKR